jgi:hypothetical protein
MEEINACVRGRDGVMWVDVTKACDMVGREGGLRERVRAHIAHTCPPEPKGTPTRTSTEEPVYSYSITDVGARGGISAVIANRGVENPYTRLLSWNGTVFSAETRT